ncbi:MAG TPA: hypothetical protein VIJ19_06245, partial [Opitutaceae bacterium]
PAATGLAQTPAAPGVPTITTSAPTTEAKAPEQPTSGLGDPVAGHGTATLPLRRRTVALACASPIGLLVLLWGALAYRKARATDPLKQRRDARRRLASTLEALRSAPSPEKGALLLKWQKDSALLWGIEKAAPPASTIEDAEWSALWSEADRFLYSASPQLAADWVSRAQAALARKTLRSFSPLTLLLPRNLFPATALVLLLATGALRAGDAAATYRSGDFAAAEKSWASQVNADPLDWAARHNLSLALAQQDRWGEATAHAAGAFIQNPSDPATRRQLTAAGDKAGFVPEPLDILIQSGPLQSLARLQSPGSWQETAILCAWLLAAAAVLILLASYGVIRRAWAAPASAALFAISVIGGTASLVGFRAYGATADTRAVIVWKGGVLRSVPTEADTAQKTVTLSAGSTAIVDKSFLRWLRLSFPNGQTGWVLDSEVVYLWQSPPAPPSAAPASSSPSSP